MPQAPYTGAELLALALTALLLVVIGMMAMRAWRLARVSPQEMERRRRAELVAAGKMGDATLQELRGDHLFYSYGVRGVEYTACQDVSGLRAVLPQELSAAGVVCVKYDPRNPANSIVIAEEWNGLRIGNPKA